MLLTTILLLVPTEALAPWTTVLGYALLPVGVMVIGALLGVWRVPSPALRGALLHFAAGVVFSVVAVDVLPDIVERRAPLEVGLGFALGLAVMFGLRYFTQRLEKSGSTTETPTPDAPEALPWGMLAAVSIDVVIDGLLLGIGFAVGAKEGTLLAIAIALEMLTLSLTTAVELRRSGQSRGKTVLILTALASMILVGAGLGLFVLQGASDQFVEAVLSFGLASLLYLVTEELLSEAHELPETTLQTLAFFGGFLLFLLLGMMA
ncbi:ZIP family metal transporter [Hymenobacter sp. 102]|uniref:ZIP family metal transporter n=1 Tax=Hymenobacter sp. 102 TaxID=3403152 RepID=UPI003CEC65E1